VIDWSMAAGHSSALPLAAASSLIEEETFKFGLKIPNRK
jgi:hypothetical protein